MSHNHSKHVDHKELSKRLQSEVEILLTNINDKTLFAEFREDEIVTIQGDEKKVELEEIVHSSLDERIFIRPKRETTIEKLDRHTALAAKKVTGFGRIFQYLFKPLQY